MMLLDELTYLGRDFGAFEAHHKELTHGPWILSALVLWPARHYRCAPFDIVPNRIVLHAERRHRIAHDDGKRCSFSQAVPAA